MCVSLSKSGSFCIPNFCHFIIANVFPPLFYASESPRLSSRTRILQDFSENPSLQLSLWPLVLIAATRYLICTLCIVALSTTKKKVHPKCNWLKGGWMTLFIPGLLLSASGGSGRTAQLHTIWRGCCSTQVKWYAKMFYDSWLHVVICSQPWMIVE